MLVFDRISSDTTPASNALSLPTEPPTEITISDFGLDAFNLFSDLCILTAGGSGGGFGLWGGSKEDKPKLLKLSSLQRTFGLELVESVLSGYEEGVKQVRYALYRWDFRHEIPISRSTIPQFHFVPILVHKNRNVSTATKPTVAMRPYVFSG